MNEWLEIATTAGNPAKVVLCCVHSILEDVLIKKFCPKVSDNKFLIYSPWTIQIHQEKK